MDPREVPFRRLTAGAALLALTAVTVSGCGRKPGPSPVSKEIQEKLREGKEKVAAAPLTVRSDGSSFAIDDDKGRRLLDAKVGSMEGTVVPGTGIQGPVKLLKVKSRLYQEGKPQIDLQAPEAVWDGKQLIATKTAHAVTADKKMIIDSQKATWTAATGELELETAKLQGMKNGKLDFTAEGAKAHVKDRLVTIPAGAKARNPEGKQLTANSVRWNMDTSRLEANGSVAVTDGETTVSGQRLVADTKLGKGRMSGGTRVVMSKAPKTSVQARR